MAEQARGFVIIMVSKPDDHEDVPWLLLQLPLSLPCWRSWGRWMRTGSLTWAPTSNRFRIRAHAGAGGTR